MRRGNDGLVLKRRNEKQVTTRRYQRAAAILSHRSFLVAAVGGAGRRCATAVGGRRQAAQALALASAAQPATADAVLLVESNGQGVRAAIAAGPASVVAGASHERDVGRGDDGVQEPGGCGVDVVRGDGAVAVHARRLLELVALLLRAVKQGAVVLVLAQELIGAIAAVLDAVAALGVWDDLAADALEAVGQAGASDVVADGLGAHREGEQGNDKKGRAHCSSLLERELVSKGSFAN